MLQKKKTEKRAGTPIVLHSASTADMVPEWLLKEIELERLLDGLIGLAHDKVSKVTDAEVCAYLMTASLHGPLSAEFTNIYIYLAAKLMRKQGALIKDSFMDKQLTEWEQKQLDDLRDKIYKKRGGEVQHPVLNAMRELKKEIADKPEKVK